MITVNNREEFLIEVGRHLKKDVVVCEIGVLHGEFSKMLLEILKPKKLFLIDPYECNDIFYQGELEMATAYSTEIEYKNLLEKLKKEIDELRVVVDRRFSYDAVVDYPNESIDMVYVDSDHRYEGVVRDLNDWFCKVKSECLICLHDYIEFGSFGVIRAVDEFLKENNLDILIYNKGGGDIAIKKL